MNSKHNKTLVIGILIFFVIAIIFGFFFFNSEETFVEETSNNPTEEVISSVVSKPSTDYKMDDLKDKVFNELTNLTQKAIESKQAKTFVDGIPDKLTSSLLRGKKTKI
ncbi:hypothetical protein [Candidatus Phytoplasma solani]|uniref:hypothetical protein n=1 Tax=Candidatus Phytoplasma solani TaxID=69896 RepID=UPI00358EEAF5